MNYRLPVLIVAGLGRQVSAPVGVDDPDHDQLRDAVCGGQELDDADRVQEVALGVEQVEHRVGEPRVCVALREIDEQLALLVEPQEKSLITMLSRYPEIVELAANNRAPQTLVHYLRDLANDFHTYYNAHKFLIEDAGLRDARLQLILATRQVLRNGLNLLGVSAPEKM